MFALGIYDKPKGTVYFYRDRIGEKPLYYIRHNRFFAFASEVKAFRGLNRTDFHYELDREMVDLFMGFTWLPESSRTMLEGVERLAPGEMLALCVSDLSVCKSVYWSLQVDSEAQSMEFHDAAEKYEEMLEKSVRDRLQADVPVGILLSGGLDSSLIAALAQKASDKPIKTFTVSLDHEKSESRFARIVSSHIGSEHHELFVEHGGMIDKLKEAIPIFDDLTSTDGGLLGTRLLCREIRKNGIKVVLLGEGADEVNAGYNKFAFSKIPFSFMPDFVGNFGYYYAIGQNLFLNHKTLAYARKTHRWIQEQVGDKLQKLTAFDIKRQLPNHLLMKVDKGSMAESVEARTPYLDYHLVEYGFSLPAEYKIKRKRANPKQPHEKYILRRIAEKYLPPEIAWRKKFGMLLSIESTVKENRNSFKELMLSDSSHPLFEYFSEDYIRSLFDVSKNMFLNREREWFIFKLVVFYLWVDYIQKAQ
jgi:asparagine synthase (glutamine-hydrolysing)